MTDSSLPMHEICQTNVLEPVIKITLKAVKKHPSLYVQWFGQADNAKLPENSQFLFPLQSEYSDKMFCKEPEAFRVVFIGKAKDWPNPRTKKMILDGPGKGNPDQLIVWLITSKFAEMYPNGEGPASLVSKINPLIDSVCGTIAPRHYAHLSVRDEELAKFHMQSASQLKPE